MDPRDLRDIGDLGNIDLKAFAMNGPATVQQIIDLSVSVDEILSNVKEMRELLDEQSYILMLMLNLKATETGLIKSKKDIAPHIAELLSTRGIDVDVVKEP
jgi:hypothetical protein